MAYISIFLYAKSAMFRSAIRTITPLKALAFGVHKECVGIARHAPDAQSGSDGTEHLHMWDAVFVVGLARSDKTVALIEMLQMRLRANADRLRPPQLQQHAS